MRVGGTLTLLRKASPRGSTAVISAVAFSKLLFVWIPSPHSKAPLSTFPPCLILQRILRLCVASGARRGVRLVSPCVFYCEVSAPPELWAPGISGSQGAAERERGKRRPEAEAEG